MSKLLVFGGHRNSFDCYIVWPVARYCTGRPGFAFKRVYQKHCQTSVTDAGSMSFNINIYNTVTSLDKEAIG